MYVTYVITTKAFRINKTTTKIHLHANKYNEKNTLHIFLVINNFRIASLTHCLHFIIFNIIMNAKTVYTQSILCDSGGGIRLNETYTDSYKFKRCDTMRNEFSLRPTVSVSVSTFGWKVRLTFISVYYYTFRR